jgi:hypothetical protein
MAKLLTWVNPLQGERSIRYYSSAQIISLEVSETPTDISWIEGKTGQPKQGKSWDVELLFVGNVARRIFFLRESDRDKWVRSAIAAISEVA